MQYPNATSAGQGIPVTGIYLLDRADIAAPNVRADVGAFRIASVSPFLLELRARNTPAILLGLGGFALAGWIAVSVASAVWKLIRDDKAFHFNMLALVFGLLGAFFLWMAVSRFGLTYTIDGATRTVRRRRLFGGDREWNATDIDHIRLKVAPPSDDAWSGRERLLVTLHGRGGEELVDPIFGYLRTATPGAVEGARAAVLMGRILAVPLWVEGVVEKGSDELKAMLAPRRR